MTELTYLLSILSRIPEMLGEGIMFGSGVVPTAVQSALKVGWPTAEQLSLKEGWPTAVQSPLKVGWDQFIYFFMLDLLNINEIMLKENKNVYKKCIFFYNFRLDWN